ncbi:MAG TPA: YlbF family regulator [Gemmatimonadaceae bacterium]|nr:YlbF family regulator [Gemmatimonadaceae bacterium]
MIDQKAKELGRLIGQSDQYKALKRANDGLGADRDSVTMLRRMEELRTDAQRMIESGQEPTADMEREMDELLGRVQGNPSYQAAVAAQENFDKLMMQVNNWIAEGIKTGAASPIITLS